jgi:aryl-alcohol dehydrogenase-like predicted oxidoreductase
METRKLGRTGLKISPLCLGTMQFGWSADESASFAVMDAYVEAGGNFLDTADVYSRWAEGNPGGVSEQIIGRWMKARGNRHSIVLATKVRGQMGPGPNDQGLSRRHIMDAVDASLRRLQIDYIDLYQSHSDDQETPLDETLGAFDDLIRQGKVRYVGASNYSAWRLTRALWESDKHDYARYDSLQPNYSLAHRDEFERELEPLCLDQGIAVIPYSPLARGFLSGKYRVGQLMRRARGNRRNREAPAHSHRACTPRRRELRSGGNAGKVCPGRGYRPWSIFHTRPAWPDEPTTGTRARRARGAQGARPARRHCGDRFHRY